VISANGLLSSLWVSQHKDESNPFLFATKIYPSRNFRTKPKNQYSELRALRVLRGENTFTVISKELY
jgi:hypothetical protein